MPMPRIQGRTLLSLLALICIANPLASVRAEEPAAADPTEQLGEAGEPEQPLPWKVGPSTLPLGHEVQLALPAGYRFLGQPEAGEAMVKMGNLYNDNLLGVVVSDDPEDDYFVTLRFDGEGFVKDDEELDGEDLLDSLREGEEEYNEERKKAGFPAIHAEGWQEAPHYDRAKHQLVWGLIVTDEQGSGINYNTRILGRKGYVSVNLVTDSKALAHDKPAAAAILSATSFLQGGRYEDFNDSTDKVAEFGLTGLVLGGAGFGIAKLVKVGLLAKFSKVILAALIAGKKAIVALLVAGVAIARKLFGKKPTEEQA